MAKDAATRKRYARGFRWGKREHRFRRYTLRITVAGLFILVLYYFVRVVPILVAGIALIALAVVTNLWAGFAHVREKHAMDSLRFWSKGK